MEDGGPELSRWLTEQTRHTRNVLDASPNRAALHARIGELTSAGVSRTGFASAGGRLFFRHADSRTNGSLLMVAEDGDLADIVRGTTTSEASTGGRVLLDPAVATGDAHGSLDWYVPSPDGRRVAVGLSRGGAEDGTLRIVEVDGSRLLDDVLPGTPHGAVSWLPDGESLVYHRYREAPPGTPTDELRLDSRSCLHRLGTSADEDVPLLARGLNDRVPLSRRDRPFVLVQRRSDWVVAVVSHSALVGPLTERLSDCSVYLAPHTALADPATCPWRRIAGPADDVTAFAMHGDTLYLVGHRGAPRGRVVAISAVDPDHSSVIVSATDRVLGAVHVVGGQVITRELVAGADRLRRRPVAGGPAEEIELPAAGSVREFVELGDAAALLVLTSQTSPAMMLRYEDATGTVRDIGRSAPSAVTSAAPPTSPEPRGFAAADRTVADLSVAGLSAADLVVTDLSVPARDGTAVGLRVVHRAGLALDGDNPTLLTGYGSYGHVLAAEFAPELLAWYERGGVYAVAGLRGGGEHGRDWHEAGRGPRKENTITDFVDCAEHLIALGYTRPDRLAGEGASAGGIPVGGAMVRRPELWAAMVLRVPVTNATRQEFSENGPVNVPEFGSVTTEDGLRDVLIIDSYLRVRDGTRYPAVLLTTALDDPRVAVWQPAKTAARLQAATASERPVLLRVEADTGHGEGVTRDQRVASTTDVLTFLCDQLGVRPREGDESTVRA